MQDEDKYKQKNNTKIKTDEQHGSPTKHTMGVARTSEG